MGTSGCWRWQDHVLSIQSQGRVRRRSAPTDMKSPTFKADAALAALALARSASSHVWSAERASSASFNLQAELERSRTGESALAYWRNIFHEQVLHTHKQCGISAILRADELIRCVWRRADSAPESAARNGVSSSLHWMDVMTDQQMETLYG